MPHGALTLLTGPGACLGTGCAPLRGPTGLLRLAISADGRTIYATGQGGGLVVLRRDPHTGRLHQLAGRAGCFRRDGHQHCTRLSALSNPGSPVVSPDGRSVYVTTTNGVLAFARNRRTGALRVLSGTGACVDAVRPGCQPLRGLSEPSELVAAGNGTLYAAGFVPTTSGPYAGAVAVLHRDPATGAIKQLAGTAGCLNGAGTPDCTNVNCLYTILALAVSRGGGYLYAGSTDSLDFELTSPGAVDTFARIRATGALTFTGCASRAEAVADVLPEHRRDTVLVSTLFGNRGTGRAYGAVDLYGLDVHHKLTRRRQLACIENTGCAIPVDLGAARLASTPRGDTVYAGISFGGVAVLRRTTHGLAPLAGHWRCVVAASHYMPPPICTRAGQEIGADLVASPGGGDLYVGTLGNGSGSFYAGGIETFTVAP